MNPYSHQPCDAPPAVNLDIIYDPTAELFLSSLFPNAAPGPSNMACPCKQPLATMAISKSEDTSHAHHCRPPDTVLTAVRSRPLPPDLAGRLDRTLSLSTTVLPFGNPIQLPVASPADFVPSATRRTSGLNCTKSQRNRASPYPRGKDNIQILSSRPSDVGHTVAARHYRRYLIFVLSITRH